MQQCKYETKYLLVTDTERDNFQKQINESLKDGWRLHSELLIVNNELFTLYAREMIKEIKITDRLGNKIGETK